MSTHDRRRRPAPRPGAHPTRLRLEALESRCACAAGAFAGALAAARAHVAPPPEPPALVSSTLPAAPPDTVVTPAAVKAEVVHLKLTAGVPFTGPVCHMVASGASPDLDGTTGMAVTIDWGNGQSTTGVVQANAGGGYDVVGTATYAAPGDYALTVKVAAADGSAFTAGGEVEVAALSDDHYSPGTPGATVPPPAGGGQGPPSSTGHGSTPVPDLGSTATPPVATPTPAPPATGGTAATDAAVTRSAARSPADTGGAVPWVRLPDPRPSGQAVATPPASDRSAAGLVGPVPAAEAPRPRGTAGDGPPAGPAYLAAADNDPPAPAADVAPIDVRPAPVAVAAAEPAADAIAVASPSAAAQAESQSADGCAARAGSAACAAAGMAAGESAHPAEGSAPRPCGLWWKSLSWCLALIFTERLLANLAADRRAPQLGKR